MSISQNATGWPPESGAHGILGFLGAATGLGFISALSSFFVLCFKYNARDVLSKNSHGYCGFNMAFVYLGAISGALSMGAAVVSQDAPPFRATPRYSFLIHQGEANWVFLQYTSINMGDPGLHCTGDSMNSYQFCTMVKAIVALTFIGAAVTLVSAVAEWRRIRQWEHVLKQLQVTHR